jgi:hypothetical protein
MRTGEPLALSPAHQLFLDTELSCPTEAHLQHHRNSQWHSKIRLTSSASPEQRRSITSATRLEALEQIPKVPLMRQAFRPASPSKQRTSRSVPRTSLHQLDPRRYFRPSATHFFVSKEKYMAEVHVTIQGVVFHNPAQHPLPPSAGKSVTVVGTSVHGTVNNAAPTAPQIVFDSPA